MATSLVIVSGLVVFDLLALRFGVDSSDANGWFHPRPR